MKMKKLLFTLTVVFSMLGVAQTMALEHGSWLEKDVPMYPIRDGKEPGEAVEGLSLDFKVVTIGNTTWAWTEIEGIAISGNSWSSQLRWWPGKIENNLTFRVPGTEQTYGKKVGLPADNPVTVTILQEQNNTFYETADFSYDYTKKTSSVDGDVTAPVLGTPKVVSQVGTILELSLSATEVNDYFYYITDVDNGFEEVVFTDDVKLTLEDGKDYTFTITAIDFSGNESEPKTLRPKAVEAIYFVEGVACNTTEDSLSFKLDSRGLNALVIQFTVKEPIADAYVKLGVNGGAIDDYGWKPTNETGDAGYTVCEVIIPANRVKGWEEGGALELMFGYISYSNFSIQNWDGWVNFVNTIAEGEYKGLPILHKIGTGVDITKPGPGAGMEALEVSPISIFQTANSININSKNEIKSVSLYSVTGQLIPADFAGNEVNVSGLTKGIYILQVKDAANNQSAFKVMIE